MSQKKIKPRPKTPLKFTEKEKYIIELYQQGLSNEEIMKKAVKNGDKNFLSTLLALCDKLGNAL
jgi:hypothetical protein